MGCGSRGFYFERPMYREREVPKDTQNAKKEDPLEILKIRFANGEISAEEFNTMKQVLLGHEIKPEETKKNENPNKKETVEKSIFKPKVSLKKS